MFGDLFGDEVTDSQASDTPSTNEKVTSIKVSGNIPPMPRSPHGFCGIYNQGATCYLNSLIQTLAYTPEFRESLFKLTEEELGSLADKDQPGSRVRVIPLHVQKLFARLLLLDVVAVKTDELTDSFGWRNNEERNQHDVQELNRILFSAIEDSLIGTSGSNTIRDLYHGTIVNQIKCETCKRTSEREEDFLDLSVTVAGYSRLEDSLCASYRNQELLNGSNKYRCSNCDRLSDALKGAKLRRLPPILTFSLLRFNFDYIKMERYKEIGKFSFPQTLDMRSYCDTADTETHTEYELYSVVIHRGSTHGGHYHAYIRDVDGIGNWTNPNQEEIRLPVNPTTGLTDVINCDSPVDLLRAVLRRRDNNCGLSVNQLCDEILKLTGVPWSKRFKKQHGTITQFLKKHQEEFQFNPDANWVTLTDSYQSGATRSQGKSVTFSEKNENISCNIGSLGVSSNSENSDGNHSNCVSENKEKFSNNRSNHANVNTGITTGINNNANENSSNKCLSSSISNPSGVNKYSHDSSIKSNASSNISCKNSSSIAVNDSIMNVESDSQLSTDSVTDTTSDTQLNTPINASISKGSNTSPSKHISGTTCESSPEDSSSSQKVNTENILLKDGDKCQKLDSANVKANPGFNSMLSCKMESKNIQVNSGFISTLISETSSFEKSNKDVCSGAECNETLSRDATTNNLKNGPVNNHSAGQWFDFDDTRVHPITAEDVEKQFSGKESAYMLFYRSTALVRPQEAAGNPEYNIPLSLIPEVKAESDTLRALRETYEKELNAVTVTLHFGRDYEQRDGALHPNHCKTDVYKIIVDRRQTVSELLMLISDKYCDKMKEEMLGGRDGEGCGMDGGGGGTVAVHIAKELPAGLHLYEKITDDFDSTLASYGVDRQLQLFVWNGTQISGQSIASGASYEPILLVISYPKAGEFDQFLCGYAKNLTVGEVKQSICERVGLIPDWTVLQHVSDYNAAVLDNGSQGNSCLGNEKLTDDTKTLQELKLSNCDLIICEDVCQASNSNGGNENKAITKTLVANCLLSTTNSKLQHRSLVVENRCVEMNAQSSYPQTIVEISDDMTVGELKAVILTQVTVTTCDANSTRLRLDCQGTATLPPLHEHMSLSDAGVIDESSLILEPGIPPSSEQITLLISLTVNSKLTWCGELTVSLSTPLSTVLHDSITRASLTGEDWHLRRTDWCSEPAEILDDLEVKVGDCRLKHGDVLALQPGRVPPKGYMYVTVHRLPGLGGNGGGWSSVVSGLADKLKDTLGFGQAEPVVSEGIELLETLTVSKNKSLQEFKQQISTLPSLSHCNISNPRLLRLRLIEGRRPARVLRGHALTLTKLKLLNGADVGVEILNEEEDLGTNELLLNLQIRNEGASDYLPPTELIWDTSQGASPASLSKAVARSLGVDERDLCLAKHKYALYEWIVLRDTSINSTAVKKNKNKKKKGSGGGKAGVGGGVKIDLKKSPYLLNDGDVIGVKIRQSASDKPMEQIKAEEFSTQADVDGRKRLEAEREAVRLKRLESRKALEVAGGTACGSIKRQELAIKIHVDDFR